MGRQWPGASVPGGRCWPVLLAVLLGGCTRATGSVEGHVTYNGKPLPSGTVSFLTSDGRVETSRIAPDGSYHIPKIWVGEIRISVQTPDPKRLLRGPKSSRQASDAAKVPDAPEIAKLAARRDALIVPSVAIPARYGDPEQSGLTYTVKQGEQTFDIELTGPPAGNLPASRTGGPEKR